MVFSNLTFVCLFLPITLGALFQFAKVLHNAVLVFASIVFYIWGGRVANRSCFDFDRYQFSSRSGHRFGRS